MSAGFKDTTQYDRQVGAGVSRSGQRAAAAKMSAAAATKARSAAAAAATHAQQATARQAALTALAAPSTRMRSYTPEVATEQISQVSRSAARSTNADEVISSTVERARERADDVVGGASGWVRPMSGGVFTSGFGQRWGRMHNGIDYACPVGTSLRSLSDGVVVAAGWYFGQGKRVVVRFDNGAEATYAHMSRITVEPGQRVEAGQRLGRSGNTGHSTGPHLHLEIHLNGQPINPISWLSKRGLF